MKYSGHPEINSDLVQVLHFETEEGVDIVSQIFEIDAVGREGRPPPRELRTCVCPYVCI
jgi:hypothetical protein